MTNGCSFTEALTLPDNKNNRWSAIVAQELNLADTNIGLGGSSNARIFRTTVEWFNVNESPDMAIIGWTGCTRDELIYHSGSYLRMGGGCLPDNRDMQFNSKEIHDFWLGKLHNEYLVFRNWIHHILHLQQYFELKKIRYCFFQALGQNMIQEFLLETDTALVFADTAWRWRDKNTMPPYKNCHPEYNEILELIQKIKFNNWILRGSTTMNSYLSKLDYPTDDSGHFLREGHSCWANIIIKHL